MGVSVGIMCLNSFAFKDTNMYYSWIASLCFVINSVANAFFAHAFEKSLRQRHKAKDQVKNMHQKIEYILNTLMPPDVVTELQNNSEHQALPSHDYEMATIAQSDLCGFTKLASTRQPAEVVQFIGELFGRFDRLTDKHGIYKVETVGDAYIAGQAERPLTDKNPLVDVLLF